MSDGVLPRNSNDRDIPRLTWWNHRGSSEWVQYEFSEPRQVSTARVYWFDDTATGGGCRLPASWSLQYRGEDGQWHDVAAESSGGAQPDQFNVLSFAPVTATAVRITVQLQPEFSGGILEWQVE
jgi:hypothetical protein